MSAVREAEQIPRAASGWSRTGSIVRGLLLNVAATLGAICICLVVLAFVFHITLIMFRTGSMSPAIPTGSLAVVKEIPASDARVGDVVTVDRAGQLPVTHRVVRTSPGPQGATNLILKGDANPSNDPMPYSVHNVRIVLWSMPGLAYVIVWLSNPLVLAALTISVAALVVWVLWPRGPGQSDAERPRHSRRKAV